MRALSRRRFLELACVRAEIASSSARAGSVESDEPTDDYRMRIATEYALEDEASIPLVQTTFASLLRKHSNGALTIFLAHSRQEGIGGTLVRKVKEGAVQAAQFSLTNFAASVPIVDLINIPYWCGDNQQFVNLVTSKAWTERVDPQLAAQGFKVLFYFTEGPRTIAKTKQAGGGPVRTPDDLRSLRVRVPPSKVAAQFYTLAGATPVVIPWGDTLSAVQRNQADALDPAVATLHTTGFDDVIASVTLTAHVPDAQVYACNLQWFNSLPTTIRSAIIEASEQALLASLKRAKACQDYATKHMKSRGVGFHTLSPSEVREWIRQTGEQRPEWTAIKTELAGSPAAFDILRRAADTRGAYVVPRH